MMNISPRVSIQRLYKVTFKLKERLQSSKDHMNNDRLSVLENRFNRILRITKYFAQACIESRSGVTLH